MALFKVTLNGCPDKKALVVSSSIDSLIEKASQTFSVNCSEYHIALKSDGLKIEDNEVLTALGAVSSSKDICELVLMKDGEELRLSSGALDVNQSPNGPPSNGQPLPTLSATQVVVTPRPGPSPKEPSANLVPWDKLSDSLVRSCDSGKIPIHSERLQMVRVIGDHLKFSVKDTRRGTSKAAAKEVVSQWKKSFQDTVGGAVTGDGSETLFRQIYARVCAPTEGFPNLSAKTDEKEKPSYALEHYGCRNWLPQQPPITSKNEAATIVLEMKGWFNESTPFNKDIAKSMKKTFYYQRVEIVKDQKTVKDVIAKWVYLTTPEGFIHHAQAVINEAIDIKALWEKNLDHVKDFFLKYMQGEVVKNKRSISKASEGTRNKWAQVKAIMKAAEGSDKSLRSTLSSSEAVFLLLIENFGEDRKVLIQLCSEDLYAGDQEAPEHPLKKCGPTPTLLVFASSIHDAQRRIVLAVENTAVIETQSLIDGMLYLLCSFYVFGMEYPAKALCTCEFLQRRLLDIQANGSRTVEAAKRGPKPKRKASDDEEASGSKTKENPQTTPTTLTPKEKPKPKRKRLPVSPAVVRLDRQLSALQAILYGESDSEMLDDL